MNSQKSSITIGTLFLFFAITVIICIISCSCTPSKKKSVIQETDGVLTDTVVMTDDIVYAEGRSSESESEYRGGFHIPIDNTIGFITRIEENRDTLNQVRILNEDGSCWMAFPADIFESNFDLLENGNIFRPWAFEPSIGVFTIRCIGFSEKNYKIVVNEDQNMIKYLEKNRYLKLETIEEHLQDLLVGWDSQENPLKDNPDDNASLSKYSSNNYENEVTRVNKIKGDWIYIEEVFTSQGLGWIRWKKNGIFLITMYYSL